MRRITALMLVLMALLSGRLLSASAQDLSPVAYVRIADFTFNDPVEVMAVQRGETSGMVLELGEKGWSAITLKFRC